MAVGERIRAWLSSWLSRSRASPQIDLVEHIAHGPGQWLDAVARGEPMSSEPDFVLWHEGTVLGHLWRNDDLSDFPWVVCDARLLPAFAPFEAMFADLQRLMKTREFDRADTLGKIIDQSGPMVVRSDDPVHKNIAMGLQITDARAWFRLRRPSS